MKNVTFRLKEDEIKSLDNVANSLHVTRSDLLQNLIHERLELHKWQVAKIECGLKDIKEGNFADENNETVQYLLSDIE